MILSQGGVKGRGKEPPLVRTLWSCLVPPRIQQLPRAPPNLDLPPSLDPLHPVLGEQELSQNHLQIQLPGRAHQTSGGNHFPLTIISDFIFFVSDHTGLVSAFRQHCTKYLHVLMLLGGVGIVSIISAHAFLVSDNWYLVSDQNLSSLGVLVWLVYFEVGRCVAS